MQYYKFAEILLYVVQIPAELYIRIRIVFITFSTNISDEFPQYEVKICEFLASQTKCSYRLFLKIIFLFKKYLTFFININDINGL